MHTVSVFVVGSAQKLGDFTFHRIPVKGDIIDIPTHDQFEVVRVTLYTERPYGHDAPIVQVVKFVPSSLQ